MQDNKLTRGPFALLCIIINMVLLGFDTMATDLTTGLWLPEYELTMMIFTLACAVGLVVIGSRRARDGGWHPAAGVLTLIPFGWLVLLIPGTIEEAEPMELQL